MNTKQNPTQQQMFGALAPHYCNCLLTPEGKAYIVRSFDVVPGVGMPAWRMRFAIQGKGGFWRQSFFMN